MTTASSVLVAIPTLNEAKHIEEVVHDLLRHDSVARKSRAIVLDGGSTDGTQDRVRSLQKTYSNLELLDNPGKTQAHALNLLLDDVFQNTQILIRCDAHAKYPPQFVTSLVESLRTSQASSVVVPMDAIAKESCFQRGLAWIADTKLGSGGSAHRGGTRSGFVDHGHHAAFRMNDFRKIGGYDAIFIANEDAEYDRRLTQTGGKIWLDANIRIGYFPRSNPIALWRQYYNYGRGRAQTCLKHRIRPALRQMIPALHTAFLFASLLLLPFTAVGWLWSVIYVFMMLVAGLWMAIKHSSLCGLMSSLALAIMHTAWGTGFLLQLFFGFKAGSRSG